MTIENKAAIVDGLTLFILPFVILLFMHPSLDLYVEQLESYLNIIVPGSIFAGVLAAWRGRANVIRLLRGKRDFIRPFFEGFVIGFACTALVSIVGVVSEVIAAGTIYDGAESWTITEWLLFAKAVSTLGLATGAIGAIVAFGLSIMNWIIVYGHTSR